MAGMDALEWCPGGHDHALALLVVATAQDATDSAFPAWVAREATPRRSPVFLTTAPPASPTTRRELFDAVLAALRDGSPDLEVSGLPPVDLDQVRELSQRFALTVLEPISTAASPEEVLAHRFAAREIDDQEYERRLDVLHENRRPTDTA